MSEDIIRTITATLSGVKVPVTEFDSSPPTVTDVTSGDGGGTNPEQDITPSTDPSVDASADLSPPVVSAESEPSGGTTQSSTDPGEPVAASTPAASKTKRNRPRLRRKKKIPTLRIYCGTFVHATEEEPLVILYGWMLGVDGGKVRVVRHTVKLNWGH